MSDEHDVVYILKPNVETDELVFSIRSVEANFPHSKIIFVGGQPEGLEPDVMIRHKQTGLTKWDRIKSSLWEAIKSDEVSEDFFLFNDDFFVMQPFKGPFINYVNRTLGEYVEHLRETVHPWLNPYGRTILKAQQELHALGETELNFEVHLPMLFNKAKAAETIDRCGSPQMRSIYGNMSRCEYIDRADVKIYDLDEIPRGSCDFLSTNDDTFKIGKAGEFIREKLPVPSRYERSL